jgi:3-oxoacyl-[acyl-carrier-protein] synthase-3
MSRFARIASTGRYVPERVISNADLEERLGPVDEWLIANVGIAQRHVMAEDQVTSDLALHAARQALERAGVDPTDLDLVIVATDTPDYPSPGTATVLQHKLGATGTGSFDVNCACAAWVTALDTASRHIATDPTVSRVLVVGAYGMTRFLDWDDKYTATLFADGAGAVVLEAGSEPGFLAGALEADGQWYDALGIFSGGTARPATLAQVEAYGQPRVEFARRMPATFNLEHWPPLVRRALAKAGLRVEDVDLFVFTQLNLRTIEATMAALEQPLDKTWWVMDKWGYTGSGCIPMALDDAWVHGRVSPGDVVVFCASGGGVNLAAAVFRWTAEGAR